MRGSRPSLLALMPSCLQVRNLVPNANLVQRPWQNFETNVTELNAILTEFARGGTTVLLAAPGDIMTVLKRANLGFKFDVSQLRTLATNVVLPVGAFLPLPGALRA
jgi:hypothetical protein